jgi:hypothetical protein
MRVFLVVAASLAGCASASEYVPLADGRVRAVWTGDRVMVDLGGFSASEPCLAQAAYAAHAPRLRLTDGERDVEPRPTLGWQLANSPSFWVPPSIAALAEAVPADAPPAPPTPSLGRINGDSKTWLVIAVIALVALPIIDFSLAAAPAEAAGPSRDAIDQVHALNDLRRSPGSPCAP